MTIYKMSKKTERETLERMAKDNPLSSIPIKTDAAFDRQYGEGRQSAALKTAIDAFVVDDKTAFRALRILHERFAQLSYGEDCIMPMYYLAEDIRDMLDEEAEYYKTPQQLMAESEP